MSVSSLDSGFSDIVVVGGGIAGATIALVLARAGLTVTVLEQQLSYRDRVRGEYMQPWGRSTGTGDTHWPLRHNGWRGYVDGGSVCRRHRPKSATLVGTTAPSSARGSLWRYVTYGCSPKSCSKSENGRRRALRAMGRSATKALLRMRSVAALRAALSAQFGFEAAARRAHFRDRVREDPNLGIVAVVTHVGPDRAPAWVFDETIRASVLNLDQAVAV